MASLSINELYKRNNFDIFVRRISIGQGFYLVDNDILVILDPVILNSLSEINDLNKFRYGRSIILPTIHGYSIPLSKLYKDSDFSNRTQYATAKQDEQISYLVNTIDDIKEKINQDFINIKITNTIYTVKTIETLNDKSKTDFCFKDINGNRVGFVSHKYGNSPRDFQQWSGTSSRFQKDIFDHYETQDFINSLKKIFPNSLPPASTVARKIKDNKLKLIAVFGNDFGKDFGLNNVEAVMQGRLILKNNNDHYILEGSHYTIKNGELPLYGYDPVFMAVHKKDRGDHWIKNCRLTINPIGSRKIKIFI